VLVCFPPFIGHTTIVTLCGFAYGMKGFFLAAPASSIGSAIVFVVFRHFCTKRLRHWSAENKKWQALESVIVSIVLLLYTADSSLSTFSSELKACPWSSSFACHPCHLGYGATSYFLFESSFLGWDKSFSLILQSVEAVALWQFVIATLFVYPKILLHVFIGSRAAALSDGKQRNHMDTRQSIQKGSF